MSLKKEKKLLRLRFLPREVTRLVACPPCQAEPLEPCLGRAGPRLQTTRRERTTPDVS